MNKTAIALGLLLAAMGTAYAQRGGQPNPVTPFCEITTPSGQTNFVPCTNIPSINPSIQVSANASGTTGALTATLSGVAGKTTYLCGFLMTSGGTTTPTAAQGTITGLAGGTQSVVYVSGGATSQGVLGAAFPGCLPSVVQGGNIVVTEPAGGTGTQAASLWIWGFLQ